MKPHTARLLFLCLLAMTGAAFAGVEENAVKASQQWQFALARTVEDLVKQGEADPKMIAKLATERTQTEEKKMREACKAMGAVSEKELDQSITRDRRESLATYIKTALAQKKQQPGKPLVGEGKPDEGIFVILTTTEDVQKHPDKLKWGFLFTTPTDTRGVLDLPTAQSASELIENLRKQPASVQKNGFSVVYPDDMKTEKDKRLIEDLKSDCRREKIPLFIRTEEVFTWTRVN